jgi:uncharacterized protein
VILTLLTAGLGKYAAIAAMLTLFGGVTTTVVVLHDRSVRAELVAQQTAAQAVVDAAQHQRVVAVLGSALAEQRAAAERVSATLEAIHDAPPAKVCIGSAAADAWLRNRADAPPSATGPR